MIPGSADDEPAPPAVIRRHPVSSPVSTVPDRVHSVSAPNARRRALLQTTGGSGRLVTVTEIWPAADADPAKWVLRPQVWWWDLVRYGPPGFDVYVRIAFPEDDAEEPFDVVRAALVTLASHTNTPDDGYAAVWEGWGANPPTPRAPRVRIPHREMLLFRGRIEALRDAPALAWQEPAGTGVPPHLVWPQDRAWCLACEVDEEIEFTVGCSGAASGALGRALPGAVRRVQYGEPARLYRDEVE